MLTLLLLLPSVCHVIAGGVIHDIILVVGLLEALDYHRT